MSKVKTTSDKEAQYSFYMLLCKFFDGLVPIDEIIEHAEFQRQLRRYCFRYARKQEDADDLGQEARLRVFLYRHTLNPANTPNERAFFGWLFVLTRNAFLSGLRRRGVEIDDRVFEDVVIVDRGPSPEDECYRSELEEFSKSLPEKHRLAFMYFLEGFSYREIQKLLNDANIRCTHVTVRTWVRNAQKDFESRKAVAAGF